MLRITSFAAIAGVSAKVLRDYDEAGIFSPAWVDPSSGYRLYSPGQLPQLRRVIALREVGVGLTAIRRLIQDHEDLGRVLRDRQTELRRHQREVERQLALLDVQLDESTDVVVRRLPAQRVAALPISATGGDVGQAFYQLEKRIQQVAARAPMPPGFISGRHPYIYVPVRARRHPSLNTQTLPECRAATVVHAGGYGTLPGARRTLRRWMQRAGLSPAGPERLVYLRFSAEPDLSLRRDYLVTDEADLLTEIQVPVAVT